MKIGLISDTHSYLDEKVFKHFDSCDEVWHAGDIGEYEVASRLKAFKPLRAVFGNIDGQDIRIEFPEHLHFSVDGLKVWMTHIGGSPPRYNPSLRAALKKEPPDIFVCGHSHILKVISDHQLGGMLLHSFPTRRSSDHRKSVV